MIAEFDNVTLKKPIPDHGLRRGTRGTVVDALHAGEGWVTVEFFRRGETVAVLPVDIESLTLSEVGRKAKKTGPYERDPAAIAVHDGARA
jgi:hypothetical protein